MLLCGLEIFLDQALPPPPPGTKTYCGPDNNHPQETSTPVVHSPLTPDVHDGDSPQPSTSKAIDNHLEDKEISNMFKLMKKRKKPRQELHLPHIRLATLLKRPLKEKIDLPSIRIPRAWRHRKRYSDKKKEKGKFF